MKGNTDQCHIIISSHYSSKIKIGNSLIKSIKDTAQKMRFFIKDFFSKCNQIRSFLRIWPNLLRKSLMENFNFCAVWPRQTSV